MAEGIYFVKGTPQCLVDVTYDKIELCIHIHGTGLEDLSMVE